MDVEALSYDSVWSDQLPWEQTEFDFATGQCLLSNENSAQRAGFLSDSRHCLTVTSMSVAGRCPTKDSVGHGRPQLHFTQPERACHYTAVPQRP